MSQDRQRRVLALLEEALELSLAERDAFLDGECHDDPELRAEIDDLLADQTESGVLARPAFSVHASDAGLGRRIGPYTLVRLLERGGMGTVYLAEREDFEHRVALKLIRRGLDADDAFVRRFENERQILARLEHPHIARLLDGGTTSDHLPYFVMEYVDGEPVDRYCAEQGLTIRERLALFRKICSAVQLAHQNLVIHRDLKPSNILITATGEPKLLDFGIAKLLDDGQSAGLLTTLPGQGPMTPRYASPEQIQGQPTTTASDVYSLGVLLYELLTGIDPYQLESGRGDELARAICEREPTKPSTAVKRWAPRAETTNGPATVSADTRRLTRRLAGDLDSIVLKAMRKVPEDRYSSAERLSEDIHRHLTGRPVGARTGTFTYRSVKYVRRHRLAIAIILAFAVLLGGLGVSWRRAELANQQAVAEKQGASAAIGFLVGVLSASDPDEARGKTLTDADLLQIAKDLVRDLADQRKLQIATANQLGGLFRERGRYNDSLDMAKLALEAAKAHYTGDHTDVATALGNLGVRFLDIQKPSEAEELFREALRMRQRLDEPPESQIRTKNNLASALVLQNRLDEAESVYRQSLETRIEIYGPQHPNVATSLRHLAAVHYARGDYAQAVGLLQRALIIRRRAYGEWHTEVAAVYDLLGKAQMGQRNLVEAEASLENALQIRSRLLGDSHRATAQTRRNIAELVSHRDLPKAEEMLRGALGILGGYPDSSAVEIADAKSLLGQFLTQTERYEEAERFLIEGYDELVALRTPKYFRTRQALDRVIQLYKAWNQPDKLAIYLAIRDPELGNDSKNQ